MGFQSTDTSVLNFELIRLMFPAWAMVPFIFMIVSGLLSTIDSNLCAVSSLTTDIFKQNNVMITKGAMVVLLLFGIVVANIPGLTVTHLFLFYGTLRSSTLLPTVFTLVGKNLKAKAVAVGIIIAMVAGLPVFAYGNIMGIAVFKTAGSLITVLTSGIIAVLLSGKKVEA